jgi:Fis family transcriptional regulator, factor for inversion stimulation protein
MNTNVVRMSPRAGDTPLTEDLNGQPAAELYELVMRQVEKPLLEIVMHETRGNITKAAQVLGINRATLRTKLHKYGIGK